MPRTLNSIFDIIIQWAIRNRLVVLFAALALSIFGIYQVRQARMDALPGFTPPIVTVQTEAPGYGSTEVEQQVSTPLEQNLLGVSGATKVFSTSSAGLSLIQLTFKDDVDIFLARRLVSERINQARGSLPSDIPNPQIAPIVSPVGALLKFTYTVEDESHETFISLSKFIRWKVAPKLQTLDGIAHVTVHGAAEIRIEIRPDPARMIMRGVRLADIKSAVSQAQGTSSLGSMAVGTQQVLLRTDARWSLEDIKSLGNTTVALQNGIPVRLSDVADIKQGMAQPVGKALQDGKKAIYIQVDKLPWADTLHLSEQAEQLLEKLDSSLPPGSKRQAAVFRQADFIRTSLWSVARAMLLGSIFVIVVLLTFLRSPRVAVISLVALPLSMLAAMLVLLLKGVTINGMVLGGLAIAVGEVVDDAVVDVENIWRRLRQNAQLSSPRPVMEVIHHASIEVRGAVVYASLVIIVVLVPVMTIGGLAGRIFSPLAESYALSILASLIVALTVTPALCALLLSKGQNLHHQKSLANRITDHAYQRALAFIRRHPGKTATLALSVGLLSLVALPFIGGGFLPEFKEGVLIGEINAWPGTSLDETTRLAKRITARLKATVNLPHISAHIGRATLDEDTAPVNRIEMDLVLPSNSVDPEGLSSSIIGQLNAIPGIRFSVDGFLGERINELLAGERAPMAIKLLGDDLYSLRETASDVMAQISQVPGVKNIHSRNLVDIPTRDLVANDSALNLMGVLRSQVIDAITASRQGLTVAKISGPKGFQIPAVIAPSPLLAGSAMLAGIPTWTSSGAVLPLCALMSIADRTEPASIQHESGQRVVTLTAQVSQNDLPAVATATEKIMKAKTLPGGSTWVIAGRAAELHRANYRLVTISLLVILAILGFLWMAFRSFTDAIVVVAGIPAGIAGGVLAALALPDGISLAAMVGFVTLSGIICRNGIMLVAHKNHLFSKHPKQDRTELIIQAAQERLRPILMTAAAAFGGLLPLALSLERAGSELESPMAVIVCGGLLTSTILNLVAVPAFYIWRERSTTHQEQTS